jgi:hypothetical protein
MKKVIFTIILLTSFEVSFSQITFDKGYFIDSNGQKVVCFIKNRDWKNIPKKIEYKNSESSEEQTKQIGEIIEFGIHDYCKYIKATVKIDRTSNRLDELDKNSNPIWQEETLLLKVLIEGDASLYEYAEGGLLRFFYRLSKLPIEQLVYKLYRPEYISEKKYAVNNEFRNQLCLDVPCQTITEKQMEKLLYDSRNLIDYFKTHYSNINKSFIDYTPKNPKEYWHFNLNVGLNLTSFSYSESLPAPTTFDFGSHISPAIGFETEIIIPYTKKHLTFWLSPNLQILEGKTVFGNRQLNMKFYSVTIPVGFRYYLPITSDMKAFANVGYTVELPINATVERNTVVSYQMLVKEPSFVNKLSIGAGVYYKKWSGEFRYYGTRSVLGYNPELSSSFSKVSFLVGYRVF